MKISRSELRTDYISEGAEGRKGIVRELLQRKN